MATSVVTPRRRSARIASNNNNNTPGLSRGNTPAKRLGSVAEHEEAPQFEGDSINATADAATPSSQKAMPGSFSTADHAMLKTPESARPTRPSHEEMHPEHAHQSTVRVSNAGLQLGFTDFNPYQSSPLRPSNSHYSTSGSNALSPPAVAHPAAKSSPGYDFNFKHDRPDLSAEAQRIMESVREEAARIKAEMRKQRDEQRRADEEAGLITPGRLFAKPKSRYSDAHQAEFDKMQSIADHVSKVSSRNNSPSKEHAASSSIPRTPSKEEAAPKTPVKTGLKRSRSKAEMDTPVEVKSASKLFSLKRSQSKASLHSPSPTKQTVASPSRADEAALGNKRRKVADTQDVSDARPVPSGNVGTSSSNIPTPKKGGLPAAASTPTKSSLLRLGRSQSAKKPSTGTIARSRSLKDIAKPGSSLRTASDRIASAVTSKVNSVKSILHKPQPKYSDDPLKIAAGTHVPLPKATPSITEGTPSLPGTPHAKHIMPRPTPKRVEFAPDTKAAPRSNPGSPSPPKKPSIRLLPPDTDSYGSVSDKQQPDSSPLKSSPSKPPASAVTYPTLPDLPQPSAIGDKSAPVPTRQNPLFSHPPSARDFTFSHDKKIVFASTSPSSSPKRASNNTTAGSVSAGNTPTSIRQVRPSGTHTPLFPNGASRLGSKASSSNLKKPLSAIRGPMAPQQRAIPAVPHGMTNKKRAREPDEDDDSTVDARSSDAENRDPQDNAESSPRKRAKMAAGVSVPIVPERGSSLHRTGRGTAAPATHLAPGRSRSVSPVKSSVGLGGGSRTGSPIKTPRRQTGFGIKPAPATTPRRAAAGGMSLSRLNFLAKPKERR